MISKPEIVQTTAQSAATIHLTIPRSDIQKVMGPAVEEVASVLRAQNVAPIGPLFSHHFKITPELFDFEVGFPIASPISPQGQVSMSELPSTTVARTIYQGPYQGLASAWGEFSKWIATENLKPADNLWERILTGPHSNPDPNQWQTELNRPLLGQSEAES